MTLLEQITADMTSAMKSQDKFTLSVLRMLKSALQMEKISKMHDLNDDEVIAVVKRQVKQRKDSITEYEKFNKTEEVENLNKEIEVMSKYLPAELSEEELSKIIDEAFNEVKPESASDVVEGNVTRTSPQAGRTVKKGTTITLYVSTGEGGVVLDDYTGQNYNKVQGVLEDKKIFVVIKKEEPEDYTKVTAEQILRQEPAKGTVVNEGGTVTLYVPDMNTTYPDFTDGTYTLEKIQAWCDKYSVQFAEPSYDMTNEYEEGKIYKQNPQPGTRVQTGQTLRIYIAENYDESTEGTGTEE